MRHALLRLHPWQDDHAAEEELARALRALERPPDLAFSLPQNRELVRDPQRWRAAVAELAERFTPYGRSFVVGQAVNRSKWGVWHAGEYRALAAAAAEELRRHRGPGGGEVEVLGPGVIDFEPLATLGLVNFPGVPRLDGLASLLYVDRRGAPEERQMGFDAAGKAALLRAIADTGRATAGRSWITEVNWPLREGPHSPAGQLVAVDEETQADYLVRYFVEVLATGHTERVYWWQLVARGYGLVCPEDDGDGGRSPAPPAVLRGARHARSAARRQRLRGTAARPSGHRPRLPLPPPGRARDGRLDGGRLDARRHPHPPRPARRRPTAPRALDRSGRPVEADSPPWIGPSPTYFLIEE